MSKPVNAMKVDVVLLTKNSEETLERCLDSIFENVPVNNLIIVDGFSTDRTPDIIEKYRQTQPNISMVLDKGTRATGRQKGIELINTEWFMFVDSDVILCENWFEEAERMITAEIGAIWGINFDVTKKIEDAKKLQRLINSFSFSDFQLEQFRVRGGCHDILIRTKAVKGIKIPKDLDIYEDAYIKRHIEKRGWKVLATKNPFCIHDRSAAHQSPNTAIKRISLEVKYGPFLHGPSSHLLRNLFLTPFKAGLIYLKSRNTEATKEHLQMYFYMFVGRLIARARTG